MNTTPTYVRSEQSAQTIEEAGGPFEVEAALLSDVGCHPEINEDCIRYFKPGDGNMFQERRVLAVVANRPLYEISMSESALHGMGTTCWVLHDLMTEEEIKLAVASVSPHEACYRLVALAKERGGYDNISMGILVVRGAAKTVKPVPVTLERPAEIL